ncbi:hypothetical protein [Roseimaritima sediminicola]|uniref:hypothetical protein n=1 Tax=Roseimaritima sediminicola TaxID=2662066 RepID=UPI0012983CCD|nr:hypothetical protein [Roseimaritima sediminicola]
MRKTKHWSRTVVMTAATIVVATTALAQPPMPSPADADYGASGFVTPAGMPPIGSPGVHPAMYSMAGQMPPGAIMHATGMAAPGPGPGQVMPVGFMQRGGPMGCDAGACDCLGYGCNRCTGGAVGSGRILNRLRGGGACQSCGGPCGRRGGCLGGCASALGLGHLGLGHGRLRSLVHCLLPYAEGGQCAQRWYDLSVEGLFLGRNGDGGGSGTISTLGVAGTPVLFLDSADMDELEAGIRLSGAFIMGAGGNIELTYMGGNKWEGNAAVTSNNADLYSFISNFGTTPAGGFDDSDRSVRHAVAGEAHFHSGELNYRRRTVGPACQFQGSWLFGMRYLRFDDSLTFSADGRVNNGGVFTNQRFLDLTTETKNDLFGVQIGGDLWWNVVPGINLGAQLKLGVLENDVDRAVFATGNSLGPGATRGSRSSLLGRSETTGMVDFTTTLIYRVSHSWAFRTSYYVLAVDEVAGGFDPALSNALLQTPQANSNAHINYGSMVLSGFTLGAEYTW